MCVRPVCPCPASTADCSATAATSFIVLDQLLGGRGNLPRGGADLGRGGRDLAGGRLLLLGGRGDLGDRRVDLEARFLHLTDQAGQFVGHPVESVASAPNSSPRSTFKRPDRSPVRIASSDRDQPAERLRNRPEQEVAEEERDGQTERRPSPARRLWALAADATIRRRRFDRFRLVEVRQRLRRPPGPWRTPDRARRRVSLDALVAVVVLASSPRFDDAVLRPPVVLLGALVDVEQALSAGGDGGRVLGAQRVERGAARLMAACSFCFAAASVWSTNSCVSE